MRASTLIGQSSGFALRADDDPEGGDRLPGAGVYAIASLELEYTTRACTDYYGNTTATYAKTTVTVAELRTVGLDRDTFVVEHRVQDAIPPLRDR